MAGPHHRGPHKRIATRLIIKANANPRQQCGRCGRLKHHCGPNEDGLNRNGTPITWTAGHINRGQMGGPYRVECSFCNYSDGGRTKTKTEPKSEAWW